MPVLPASSIVSDVRPLRASVSVSAGGGTVRCPGRQVRPLRLPGPPRRETSRPTQPRSPGRTPQGQGPLLRCRFRPALLHCACPAPGHREPSHSATVSSGERHATKVVRDSPQCLGTASVRRPEARPRGSAPVAASRRLAWPRPVAPLEGTSIAVHGQTSKSTKDRATVSVRPHPVPRSRDHVRRREVPSGSRRRELSGPPPRPGGGQSDLLP